MARLKDVPVVIRSVGLVPFLKRLWGEICDDHLFTFGAALAYAWLFAIFPFIIFLLNLVGFLTGADRQNAVDGIHYFLQKALPDMAAQTISGHVNAQISNIPIEGPRGGVLSLSILITLWAASGGITVTMSALEKCYEQDKSGRKFYKRRPMAFGLTAMVSALLFAVVLLLPAGAWFKNWVIVEYREWHISTPAIWAFDIVRTALAAVMALLILAVLYHFGPSVKHRWHVITPGAVFTLTMWTLLGLGFRYYVNHFGSNKYEQSYGTVGGVAILLLVFYIDAVVLLIGAEINSEIDYEILKVPRGSKNFRIAERIQERREHPPQQHEPAAAVASAAAVPGAERMEGDEEHAAAGAGGKGNGDGRAAGGAADV
jgi:membrane protein